MEEMAVASRAVWQLGGKVWGGISSVLKLAYRVFDATIGEALERLVPHGASEVANMLYTGNAYVPYGTNNLQPEPPKAEPVKETSIEEHAQRGRAVERDRESVRD